MARLAVIHTTAFPGGGLLVHASQLNAYSEHDISDLSTDGSTVSFLICDLG